MARTKATPPTESFDHHHPNLRNFSLQGYQRHYTYVTCIPFSKDGTCYLPSVNSLESLVLRKFSWYDNFCPEPACLQANFNFSNLQNLTVESAFVYPFVDFLGNTPGNLNRLRRLDVHQRKTRDHFQQPICMMEFLPKLMRRLTALEDLKLSFGFGEGGFDHLCQVLAFLQGTLTSLSL